jgi:hypothetical protein
MSNEKMFESATRTKMRFPFKGLISVEDLWDLSVTNLDSIFKTLNSQVKQAKEESLLTTKSQEDKLLDMQIEIVKYIVKVKQEEEIIRLQAKELKEKKQKIMAVLSAKEDQALQNMSVEELQNMLGEIGG